MTKEEAKEKLYMEWQKFLEDNIDYAGISEAYKMAFKALEQTRWIPVSERLPEKNMECLVTVGDFNLVQTAMYSNLMRTIDHRIFYQGECGDETFKNITQYVTAWMPLPQPYKGESEDKK